MSAAVGQPRLALLDEAPNSVFFKCFIFSESTGHSQEKVECFAQFAFARAFSSAAFLLGASTGKGIDVFSFRKDACSFRNEARSLRNESSCCCFSMSDAAMKLRRCLSRKAVYCSSIYFCSYVVGLGPELSYHRI